VIAAGPIGRDPAQRLAQEELSKALYHQRQPIPQLIVHAIQSFLNRLFSGVSSVTPGGGWTVLAVAALLVIIVAVIAGRLGPLARTARRAAPLLDSGASAATARQLREAAQACAAAGDYSTAILQRLRAIARGCEERGLLAADAGRTADELSVAVGALFPAQRDALADAARQFDEVRYGDGTGTQDGYERLRALDDALARLSPARAGDSLATAGARPGA
jgi:hypothetical protein